MREVSGARAVLSQIVRRGAETLVEGDVTVAIVDRDERPQRFTVPIRDGLLAQRIA